ncbi:MAG: hypothetical protein Q8R25_03490, partial [bacterium]|nr:hypothetical protein [bacterium]
LLLNESQRYLGRSYVWLKRPGEMQRLSELADNEKLELFVIMREYEMALERLWQPNHMNYAWLGNDTDIHDGHGHMHMIPRYRKLRVFAHLVYIDENWKKNYVPYEPHKPTEEVLFKIRDALRGVI